MCGIVGVLGTKPVAGSIVDALKRLEYRGYDSAGLATLENGRLARRRAEGKLKNLEAKLAAQPLSGSIGIGHTRWGHGRSTGRPGGISCDLQIVRHLRPLAEPDVNLSAHPAPIIQLSEASVNLNILPLFSENC